MFSSFPLVVLPFVMIDAGKSPAGGDHDKNTPIRFP
jgi:hypothetical protein